MKDKVIIVGHGASGKDHLSDYLIEKKFKKNISYTTRPIRDNEVDEETYFFISVEDFKEKIEIDFWHEYNVFVNDWYYGSSKEQFEKRNLFIKEPHGISLLSKEERERSYIVYVNIDESIRRGRLYERKDADSVERRLEGDSKDFENFTDFDLVITNPNFSAETILFKIMSETTIKAMSSITSKEMLMHNVYLTYTENTNNFITFNTFFEKVTEDEEFSNMYKEMLENEKNMYLN